MNSRLSHLRFTIGTGLDFDDLTGYSVQNEIKLVKSALLYADSATLFSPGVSLVMQTHGIEKRTTTEQRRSFMVNYLTTRVIAEPSGFVAQLLPVKYRMLVKSKDTSLERKREIISNNLSHLLGDDFDFGDDDWNARAMEMWGEFGGAAGADSLVEAADSGLLELHEFEEDQEGGWADNSEEKHTRKLLSYIELIQKSMTEGKSYPLFDDQAGDIAKALVEEGVASLSEVREQRARQSALAADVLQRLPTFEQASINQTLEVRSQLEQSLVNFRSAIIEFSEELNAMPWTEDFALRADDIMRKKVEPAVTDIEKMVNENSSLRSLASKAFRPGTLATGLQVGFSILQYVPDLVSLIGGVGVAAGKTIRDTFEEHAAFKADLESKQMYFYYGANQRLGGSR